MVVEGRHPNPVVEPPTRIVLVDRRTTYQQQQQQQSQQQGGGGTTTNNPNEIKASQVYKKLRVRIEIHPVSNSNYFHIVVHLYFESSSPGNNPNNDTTDVVELLFLAETSRTLNNQYQRSQGYNTHDNTTSLSTKFRPSGLVEIAIGGELLMVHVLSEQKSNRQTGSMRYNQSLSPIHCTHCVTVKVTKGDEDLLSTTNSPQQQQQQGGTVTEEEASHNNNNNRKPNSSRLRWPTRLPTVRTRVVTDGEDDQSQSVPGTVGQQQPMLFQSMRSDNAVGMNEVADDWMDRMIWFPTTPTSSPPPPPSSNPTTTSDPITTVCLQSWSVRSMSTHEILMPPASQNVFNGLEGAIVAQGSETESISGGMDLLWV